MSHTKDEVFNRLLNDWQAVYVAYRVRADGASSSSAHQEGYVKAQEWRDQWNRAVVSREPRVHTGIEDCLPGDHPLAYEVVYCERDGCEAMLHAFNNECMRPWVETAKGGYCISCFAAELDDRDEQEYGLPAQT